MFYSLDKVKTNDWLQQPTNLLLFVTTCICVINSASESSFALNLSQRVILTMLDFKQQYKSINSTLYSW